MSLTLGEVIDAIRDRNPELAPQRVPNGVIARYLTGYQRELFSLTNERYPELVTGQVSIVFPPVGYPANSPVSAIGAGTAGGLPAALASNDTITAVPLAVGNTIQLPVNGAPVLFGPSVTTGASQTTLTAAGSPLWATNQYAGQAVAIVAGTDVGDVQMIASNTSNTLTVQTTGLTIPGWDVVPDTTSVFTIVSLTPDIDLTTGYVVGYPMTATRLSYLVRLDANGNAFLDLTAPAVGQYDLGILLPQYKSIIGNPTIYFQDSTSGYPYQNELTIVDYKDRLRAWGGGYCAYLQGNQIFFIGFAPDWQLVQSIDIRYVPVPAPLTALTDTFTLPDDSYQTLVARGAQFCAERLVGQADFKGVDLGYYSAQADRSEQIWIDQIGTMNRIKTQSIREVWTAIPMLLGMGLLHGLLR